MENRRIPLTLSQRLALIDVIDDLESVNTSEALVACLSGSLQDVMPYGGVACALANIKDMKPYRLLLHNFPRQALDDVSRSDGTIDSPLIECWRERCEPIVIDFTGDVDAQLGERVSERYTAWLAHVHKHDYRNAAAHGLADLQGELTSFFCFIRIPGTVGKKQIYLLNFLTPHLHSALVRAMATLEDVSAPVTAEHKKILLNARQSEVLHWLHCGKTNREIAAVLAISEANVKYYVREIFAKLNASNRADAVSKALALKIISLEMPKK
ncbi:MAG: hypothetical protein HY308_11570 [Gammaproteobacteria bacterium]|nr:hypothetical protein [Gammaproteobacteria bacterium]